jgi:hypothetical protein
MHSIGLPGGSRVGNHRTAIKRKPIVLAVPRYLVSSERSRTDGFHRQPFALHYQVNRTGIGRPKYRPSLQ